MTTHLLHLADEPFDAIAAGRKTIESRLYDDKRKAIRSGDRLQFVRNSDHTQTIEAEVTDLIISPSFDVLFASRPAAEFGGSDVPSLLNQIRRYYDPAEEDRYGVLGIRFKRI